MGSKHKSARFHYKNSGKTLDSNHSITNLTMVSIKSVPRKIAQVLKAKINKLKKYQELPQNSHQEEVDENAQNEALEARLMELIASAPQQNLDQPWFLKLDQVPANLDHLPTFQTFCQRPQAQQ